MNAKRNSKRQRSGSKRTPRAAGSAASSARVAAAKNTRLARALPPRPTRQAGLIASAQSAVGIGYALLLIVRELLGKRDGSIVYTTDNANTWVGYGTAVFFIIVFGAVLAGVAAMNRGHRLGRGPVLMLEMLLLPISIYMFRSGAAIGIIAGVITLVSAGAGLFLLMTKPSVEWASRR